MHPIVLLSSYCVFSFPVSYSVVSGGEWIITTYAQIINNIPYDNQDRTVLKSSRNPNQRMIGAITSLFAKWWIALIAAADWTRFWNYNKNGNGLEHPHLTMLVDGLC